MRCAALAFMIVLVACGDGAGPADSGPVSISGLPAADTVRARLPGPILVRLRDSAGAPLAGATVTFDALPPDTAPNGRPAMIVSTDSQMHFGRTATGITDSTGGVWALALLGCYAGPARLRIRAASRHLDTTVAVELKPGNAHHFTLAPKDTAVFVGSNYRVRAGVRDACDNTLPDTVHFSAGGGAITISHDTVTGVDVARVMIVASSGAFADTAWATPVPRTMIVAIAGSACTILERRGLDGTNGLRLSTGAFSTSGGCLRALTLAPGGAVYVSVSNASFWDEVWRADGITPPVRVLGCPNSCLPAEWPQVNPAGTRIYYGQRTAAGSTYEYWTASSTGVGQRKFIQPAATTILQPSISPDERRVLFVYSNSTNAPTIQLYDSLTQVITPLAAGGQWPAWSPGGATFAFLNSNKLFLYSMATSRASDITPQNVTFSGPMTWTPDGNWILLPGFSPATGISQLWLVDGRETAAPRGVPVPLTQNWSWPTARPLP